MTHAVLARIVRSGFTESVHHGTAVALDPTGAVVTAIGDPGSPVLPRSANKLLQAVAMLRAGLGLDGPLLALTASSHSGERFHLDGVERLLHGAGLDVADLGNTPDLPLGEPERIAWEAVGRPPSRLAQNCSGKHAAMLATCRVNGWPTGGYLDPGHPLQERITATVADLCGEPVAHIGTDGCGAPLHAVSLLGLARAYAGIASAPAGTVRARLADAVRTHPEWLAGTGRDVTLLIRGVPGLIAKDGAEGVYAAALQDGRAAAVKIADGAARARPVVMAALLRRLGEDAPVLTELERPPVLGGGVAVGTLEAVGL